MSAGAMGLCEGVAEGDAPRVSEGVGEAVREAVGVALTGGRDAVDVVLGVGGAVADEVAVEEGDGDSDLSDAALAEGAAESVAAAVAVADADVDVDALGACVARDDPVAGAEPSAEALVVCSR